MNRQIRITLVEDNIEYRQVIQLALEHVPELKLLKWFGTAEVALQKLQLADAQDKPDLILLDLRLPGMDGLTAIPQFRTILPDAKIVVLTQSDREQDVLRAITLGAAGYLLKSAALGEITDSIREVIDGGAPLDKSVAKYLLQKLQAKSSDPRAPQLLSDRELEVLGLLARGLVKKEIAGHLNIRYSTVDTYVTRIYEKLNVTNAASAVDRAHRLGIFSSGDTDG